jgi:nitrogen fixation protein NifZ
LVRGEALRRRKPNISVAICRHMEPASPKFQWGQRVRACLDLYNDGSFPDWPPEALLARSGDVGEIVQVGTHTDSRTSVYLVEFAEHRMVGCLEQEIAALKPNSLAIGLSRRSRNQKGLFGS